VRSAARFAESAAERAPSACGFEREPRVINRTQAPTSDNHEGKPKRSGEVRHGGRGREGNEKAARSLDDHPRVSRCKRFKFLAKPGKLDSKNASLSGGDDRCGRERECHGTDLAEHVLTFRGGLKGLGVEWAVPSDPGFHRLHHADIEPASAQPAGKGARDDGFPDTRVRTGDKEAGHVRATR
jgi:hypothetical protein